MLNKGTVDIQTGKVVLYYGQTLKNADLSAFVPSVKGAFTWNGHMEPDEDYRPLYDTPYYYVAYLVFTPEDPNYAAEQVIVRDTDIQILPVTPTMHADAKLSASEIQAGNQLSSASLNFEGSMINPYYSEGGAVEGTWSWKDAGQSVTTGGTYTAVFAPSDTAHYLPVEIPVQVNVVHSHSYGGDWKSDETTHWHVCACGAKSEDTAHTFQWIIDKEATSTETGLKHEECQVCGYKKVAVEIPATEANEPTEPESNEPVSNTNTSVNSPHTGDNANLTVWILLFILAGSGMVGMAIYSRKKKYSK